MGTETQPLTQPAFILVMGVSGAGKSTVASAIAQRIGAGFVEADDFHSPQSLASLGAGYGLTDAMRLPWLSAVAQAAIARHSNGRPVVIACSALKRQYRDLLRAELGSLAIVYLTGEPATIRRRLDDRHDHFMSPDLLDSQFADLEPPDPDEAAISLAIASPLATVVHQACVQLAARASIRQSAKDQR